LFSTSRPIRIWTMILSKLVLYILSRVFSARQMSRAPDRFLVFRISLIASMLPVISSRVLS